MTFRTVVLAVVASLLILFGSRGALAEDDVKMGVLSLVTEETESRTVQVGISWINGDKVSVPKLKTRVVDASNPINLEVMVGQNYHLILTDGATGQVLNRPVYIRYSVVTIKLKPLAHPTLLEQNAELRREIEQVKAQAKAEITDREIKLAIAEADKKVLEKDKQVLKTSLDTAIAYNQANQLVIAGLVLQNKAAEAKINDLTVAMINAQDAQRQAEHEVLQKKTEVINLGNQLAAAQEQAETYRQLVNTLDAKSDQQEIELERLHTELAVLRQGEATGRGLTGGIGYVGSWEPRQPDSYDTPIYADFYNDSVYQNRVGEVQILFKGRPVDRSIAPISVTMRDEQNWYQLWGNGTVVQTFWREDLGGWLAVMPVNKFIDAKGHSRPRISFSSTSFHIEPGLDNQVEISVISTWSFDGVSIQTGPDHGTGTVVVTYNP